jgi:hypothetical protein
MAPTRRMIKKLAITNLAGFMACFFLCIWLCASRVSLVPRARATGPPRGTPPGEGSNRNYFQCIILFISRYMGGLQDLFSVFFSLGGFF